MSAIPSNPAPGNGGALNHLQQNWSSIRLSAAGPNRYNLAINGITVWCEMPAEFAVWQAAKVVRLRRRLSAEIAAVSPKVGQA